MWTFAYGGNLDVIRMRRIAPDIHFVCRAYYPDHTIGFSVLHEGIPQIAAIPRRGYQLWGVVYEIPDGPQVEALDKAEGIVGGKSRSGYRRVLWSVTREDGRAMDVHSYVTDETEDHVPDRQYVARVFDWARFWDLPGDHLEMLKDHLAHSRKWHGGR